MAEKQTKNEQLSADSQADTQKRNPAPEEIEQMRVEWIRAQFRKANKFMAEKGVIPSKVHDKESRYLAPYMAVWKMESKQPAKKTYWVMSGDLPSDMVDVNVAKTAREAVRHFSMTWQLKAENLIRSGAAHDEIQAKYANLLISRAQSLYQMQSDDKLWGEG